MSDVIENNAVCPNCNTELNGEFCYECGQKRIHHPETVGHFVRHFFDDITHFDSKFFKSLIPLLFKPGFLTTEYESGRRASYLNPIRAYLFLSFIYFFLFFSLHSNKKTLEAKTKSIKESVVEDLKTGLPQFENEIDLLDENNEELAGIITKLKINHSALSNKIDSIETRSLKTAGKMNINFYSGKINIDSLTADNYEREQLNLPKEERDNFLLQILIKRQIKIQQKYNGNGNKISEGISETASHNFPKMLFFLIPLYALILKLLYPRREILYVSHAIFSLHYFSFIFCLLSVSLLIQQFVDSNMVTYSLIVLFLIYSYKAMHNFYKQNHLKTIIKFVILNFTFIIFNSIAMLINLLISYVSL